MSALLTSFNSTAKLKLILLLLILCSTKSGLKAQQVRILFDATKAETAGNADWVIDEDLNNMTWNPNATVGSGSEGNAQRIPTPAQSNITSSTLQTYWKGALSAWGIDCVKKGYAVETLPYNGSITYGNTSNVQDLSNYQVFVITEPNILFTTAEKTSLIQYVQNGGSLFLIADHINSDRNNDGEDSPEIFNDLFMNNGVKANPFGFTFDSVSISPLSSNIPNLPLDSLLHGPMGNVTQVMWASGNTMSLYPEINPSVKGIVYNTGMTFGNKGVMVCYARYGKGKVVAMGDSSPADDGSGDTGDNLYDGWIADASGNHERLIMNGTIWLATKDSVKSNPTFIDLSLDTIKNTTYKRGLNHLFIGVKNKGTTPIDSFVVYTQIDQLPKKLILVPGLHLLPGDTATITSYNALLFDQGGTHSLKVWLQTSGDTLPRNDTISTQVSLSFKTDATLIKALNADTILEGFQPMDILVKNTGETIISALKITYRSSIDTVVEMKTGLNLNAGDSLVFHFTKSLNITSSGNQQITYQLLKSYSGNDSASGNSITILQYVIKTGLHEQLVQDLAAIENPIHHELLHLYFSHPMQGTLSLFNLQGMTLQEIELNQEKNGTLLLNNIAQGIYLLTLKTDQGIFFRRISILKD